jgi:leader peptidase (prepilin peptidase)/N-methyltransferase
MGVLIRRLPRGEPVVLARSRCPACGTTLGWSELVPLLSFLWLRGACRHCGDRIDRFHVWVELAALAVAVWAIAVDGPAAWLDCVLGWTLLTLAWIDAERMVLPDVLTLPLVVGGLLAAWLETPEFLLDRALGTLLGWGSFTLVAAGYWALRGRDGLGGGDAKLLAAAGAWLGWEGLPSVILAAALSALVVTLTTRAVRRSPLSAGPLPFGPWLAAAIWLVRLYGDRMVPG